jgi:hypothetical protein
VTGAQTELDLRLSTSRRRRATKPSGDLRPRRALDVKPAQLGVVELVDGRPADAAASRTRLRHNRPLHGHRSAGLLQKCFRAIRYGDIR